MRHNQNRFKITRQTLAEMQQLASKTSLDTSKLEYSEVQQVLTLHSLMQLLATYQIELEIEFSIEEITDVAITDSWA